MSRVVIFVLLLFLNAAFAISLTQNTKVTTKKDQIISVNLDNKILTIRWTLFESDGIVVHYSYDGFVHQNVLYKNSPNSSFRIKLRARNNKDYQAPYLLINIEDFNKSTKDATFTLYLYGEGNLSMTNSVTNFDKSKKYR
jgi:hypothetical protein